MANEKWNLIFDVALCHGCNNCVLAAKDEYVGNEHSGYTASLSSDSSEIIAIERKVRGTTPMVDAAHIVKMCNHCDNAPCMKAGGDAVTKREDGIVIIDPTKAKGRREIVDSCPYGAIVWNEEKELPQTWIFDAHLLDQGWKMPRCQQSCPTGAFEAVKVSDDVMSKRVQGEGLEVLSPELGTSPRVFYKNLSRFDKCFIGGTVISVHDDVEDCVAGAAVELLKDGKLLGTATTDEFGEFKFDSLDAHSGGYEVHVKQQGFDDFACPAVVEQSIYLGELILAS